MERKEICYLTKHSTHFIYGYMAPDIYTNTHTEYLTDEG